MSLKPRHKIIVRSGLCLLGALTLWAMQSMPAYADSSQNYVLWNNSCNKYDSTCKPPCPGVNPHFNLYPGKIIHWKDDTGAISYGNAVAGAASKWNTAMGNNPQLVKQTTQTQIDWTLHNDGKNGFAAFTHTVPCNSLGQWTATIQINFNTYYTTGYTPTELADVAIHEFGHAFGLGHWMKNPPCSSVEFMDPSFVDAFRCNYTAPRAGDVGGVRFLYP